MIEARGLWDLVTKRAEATPDAPMLVAEDGTTMTFAGYRDAAERSAAGLESLGIGTDDVVSWELPTTISAVVLVAALARLGAVQNPIVPIYREREVGFIARQASPKLLVVPSAYRGFDFAAMAAKISGDVDGLDVLVMDGDLPEGDPSTLSAEPGVTDDVRWLFYTSGTTADPKGARHTDATVMATATGMTERLGLRPDDRNALVFPFTHIGGIIWLFSGLQVGFTQLVVTTFDPGPTIGFLRANDVTIAGAGTPFHMAYLAAQRASDEPLFPNLRMCPGGGAPKPPQLHVDVRRELGGAGIVSGYGLTEAPILTMASPDDPDDALAHTEGRPMPGVEIRVVTLDGDAAGPGEEGEIRAKAPQLMAGYVDAALDADAFDDGGYFRTGDLGVVDDRGFVKVTGRLKDVIIRKGENVSAKEVEDALFEHPNVSDVAVIGLPDAERGEMVCAVVVPDGDAPALGDLTGFLEGKGLRRQALPERLEIVDELPRTPAGKVLKQDLKARLAD